MSPDVVQWITFASCVVMAIFGSLFTMIISLVIYVWRSRIAALEVKLTDFKVDCHASTDRLANELVRMRNEKDAHYETIHNQLSDLKSEVSAVRTMLIERTK